jgi:hypothetical protein
MNKTVSFLYKLARKLNDVKVEEWENFVRGVNEANKNLKEIFKG